MIIHFITSIRKSQGIFAKWLALSDVIYSWIAVFCALNRTFFPTNQNVARKQKRSFKVTNQLQENENKFTYLHNYLQVLNDDSELLEAEEVLLGEFPTFNVQFDEYFDNFSFTSTLDLWDPEPSNRDKSRANSEVRNVDATRFPEISSEEIEELKAIVINKNTSNSTEQWINIFKSWCQSWHPENVNMETMAPEELDNILSKLYAKVKKR